MGSFSSFEKSNTAHEYIPALWLDDYYKIELVPSSNKDFITKQSSAIAGSAKRSATGYGFAQPIERGGNPFPTLSAQIKINAFETILLQHQFQQAKYIVHENSKVIDCKREKINAFGFPNFTVYVETEHELVSNTWIVIRIIPSNEQRSLISAALHELGTTFNLLLIDWNSLEMVDLKDQQQVHDYLSQWGMFNDKSK